MNQVALRRFSLFQIHLEILMLFSVLSLMPLATSFTPPKIIYGGWTPILPGHPFFFGGASKKHYEQYRVQSQPQYSQHSSKYLHYSPEPDVQNGMDKHVGYGNQGHREQHNQLHQISYNDRPRESYNKPKIQNQKNIFSYYPPQSSYETPPQHGGLNYKPVYLEIPRKPFEILENPHKFVPYILPSLKELFPKGLKIANHGKEQTYLNIEPIGKVDPHSIHPIGHLSLDKLQYVPNLLNKAEYKSGYDSVKPSIPENHEKALYPPIPHSSQHHDKSNFVFMNHNHIHNTEPHNSYDTVNNFRGTKFPHHASPGSMSNHQGNDFKDTNMNHHGYHVMNDVPSKSISTAYYVKEPAYRNLAYAKGVSLLSQAKTYPANSELRHNIKYVQSDNTHSETTKDVILPSTGSGSIAFQAKDMLEPNTERYHPSKSYYILGHRRPSSLSPGSYRFNQYLTNPSSMAPYKGAKYSVMPKLIDTYVPKTPIVENLYRNPSMLNNIRGSPAGVEREVSIVHVPVGATAHYSNGAKSYAAEDEVIYLAASTPKSVEVSNFQKRNDSRHFVPLRDHHSHFNFNETFLDHDYKPHSNPESLSNGEEESIFVGTRGVMDDEVQDVSDEDGVFSLPKDSNNRKQVFHAYYAPSDHLPPKGYMKMSVDEFHKVFKNAEIQYIKRSHENIPDSRREEGK